MSKNTIIRFPEQMSMERALNHNMNWTIKQFQTLARGNKRLSVSCTCANLAVLGVLLLWVWNSVDVAKLQSENRILDEDVCKLKKANRNLVDDLDKMHERLEALEEGRTQM